MDDSNNFVNTENATYDEKNKLFTSIGKTSITTRGLNYLVKMFLMILIKKYTLEKKLNCKTQKKIIFF